MSKANAIKQERWRMHCLHLFTTGNITRHSFADMESAFTIKW